MKNIEINIGNACNNECRFCMIEYEDSRSFVDFDIIKKEIIRAKRNKFGSIGFLGGEFTLHPDVFKIVKLSKLLGFKIIHIISNGRKYNNKKFLEQLIKSGVNRFSVSIHSHEEEVEDYLTQKKGGFAEKLEGLRNLVDLTKQGLIQNPISLNFVINGKNYEKILESLKFFTDLGIKDYRFNFIWLHGRAGQNQDLFLKYGEFIPYLNKLIDFAKKKKIRIAFEGIPACLIDDSEKQDYIGELRDMNTQIVAYNNPDKNREQFNWQERKKNEFKIKHKKCQQCQWDNVCDGVWRDYIKNYGWDEFKF